MECISILSRKEALRPFIAYLLENIKQHSTCIQNTKTLRKNLYLYINLACLGVCLSVCMFVSNKRQNG